MAWGAFPGGRLDFWGKFPYSIRQNQKGVLETAVGLVLEGGAMRGMYTAGILDVFLEQGAAFDGIVGVSAGALFGVNFLSRQKGRVIRYNKRFNGDKNYMGLRPFLKEGNFFSTRLAYGEVPRRLDPFDDETYRSSPVPFYAVVTNVDTGLPEYMRIRSVFQDMDVLRASGSMPILSQPVSIGGKRYLDGGITDSIPFLWMARQGFDKLAVLLTRHKEYRKKPMPAIVRPLLGKYPKIAEAMAQRPAAYNRATETLSQWEQEGKAWVLRPSAPIEIGRTERDPEKLQAVYDLGRADALRNLEGLRAYLQK